MTGTISGADGRKVRISYQANGYLAQQVTLAANVARTFALVNLNRASTWTITFDLYKADGTTIERSITRWVGPGNEDVVLNQDLAGAPAGNVRVRLTDLGQAFDVGIRLPNLHVQVTARDFDGVQCLGVVRTTSYNVAQTAGDNVAMDVILPMPTGQFCVKVTPYVGSPSNGGTVAGAYQDPVTISAVTPDSGSPVNAITVSAADQAVDATVMVTLRPKSRTVVFSGDGSITSISASAVTVNGTTYWPAQSLSNPAPANTFSNVRPGRWLANGDSDKPFALPIGEGTATLSGTSFTDASQVSTLAFISGSVTGSATGVLPTLQVELRDGAGLRMTDSSTVVTLSADCGACLYGETSVTASNGVATFTGTRIERADTHTITASAGSVTTTFDVVINPTELRFVQQPVGTNAGSTLLPVAVEVFDTVRNTRVTTSNAQITVTMSAGALFSGNAVVNAVNGLATFSNLSVGNTGTYTMSASSGMLTATTSASFEIVAAGANELIFASQPAATAVAGETVGSVTVAAQRPDGSVLTSFSGPVSIGFASNSTGAVLSGVTTVNAVNGVATFNGLSIATAGTGYKLAAASSGLVSAVSTAFEITAVADPTAASVAFLTQPANLEAGQVMNQIQVEIRDGASARVVSFNGEVALAVSSGATLSGTTTISAVNGVATFTNLSTTTAGSFTLEATSEDLNSTTSASFTVSPAAASAVQSTFTYSVTVGSSPSTAALTVTIKDSFGNIRTTGGDQVFFSVTSKPEGATATLSASTVTSTQGVAAAELEVSEAGSYSVQARLGSSSGPVIGTVTIVFPGDPDG